MKNIRWGKGKVCLVLLFLIFSSANISFAADNDSSKVFPLSENLDVDPSSGTASLSIPIEVLQGRAGIAPSLTLFYNSSSGNGLLGVGWNFELGNIQRSTKKGIPQYNNNDTFIFTQAGSNQELVDISGNGTEFRPKIEGAFMKIQFDGTSWTLTDRKGTRYFFGTSASSRVADPNNAARIFKWHLERVEDINSNFMTISYWAVNNLVYPQEIKYTGNVVNNLLPYASVKFLYDTRTNPTEIMNSYMPGFNIVQSQRLIGIEVYADGNRLRKYDLNYVSAPVTGKSLLDNVTLVGVDGVSTLPATKMTYNAPAYNLDPGVSLSNFPAVNLGNSRIRMMDMNNDGLPDIVDGTASNYKVYINQTKNGVVSFASPVVVTNSPTISTDDPDIRIADFNGDGLLDISYMKLGSNPTVWINTGALSFTKLPSSPIIIPSAALGFTDMNNDGVSDITVLYYTFIQGGQLIPSAQNIFMNDGKGNFSPSIAALNSPGASLMTASNLTGDFNGDGLLDLMCGTTAVYYTFLNNGANGYMNKITVKNFPKGIALSSPAVQLADMNGDGLTDILLGYKLYLNNGQGDFNPGVVMNNAPNVGFTDKTVKIVDFNGDHLPDVVVGVSPYKVYLNDGNGGFLPPVVLTNSPSVNLDNPNIVMADINGDGMIDFVYGDTSGYKVWTSSSNSRQAQGNSLTDEDNSLGGHLEIKYQNLPVQGWAGLQYANANSRMLLNTVQTISRRASLTGDVYTTTYDYQGGLYDTKSREFRGFKTVKMIDPDGNYSVTQFAQDDIYKGRPLSQASYDSQNRLFSKSENTWDNQVLYPGVNFTYLKQTDSYVYDGDATGRRTQAQFFYEESPQYGNLTRSINFGEVDLTTGADIGTDKSTTEITYHNNTTAWLLGLPKITTIKDNSGTQFAKTTFYYDYALDENVLPAKGFLTKKVDWAGDNNSRYGSRNANPTTKYTYDGIGNLLTTSDSFNSTTSIVYDNTYKMFPLETTNALGHKVTNEYYGINGVPLNSGDGTYGLWGQLKSTTDPNNKKGLRIYDTFGRTVKMVSPLDTIALPTTSYEYIYGTAQLKVISHQRIQSGLNATIDNVSFYDGLGRLVESKSNSENPGQYIVGGQSEYNSRGLPVKKYVSYFTSKPILELDPIDTNQPYTLISYDAMGRVIRTTAPDGSYSNGVYDDWNSTSFDENGHMQKSYADAFGRLIKKEEYTGSDGRNSAYPASSYTLYATTLYSYDAKGNLIQTQDAKGNITTITYDTLGRKIRMNDPDMGTWQYGYDIEGNLIWQQDAKGQRINFSYDQINRLKSKTDLSVLTVNYTYDDINAPNTKGRLTNAAYSGGNTGFSYDDIGRELQSIKAIGSTNFAVNRTYDAVDRLVTLQYPQSNKVGYTYNAAGLVNSVFQVLPTTIMPSPLDPLTVPPTAGQVYVKNVDYNALGQMTKVEFGNGVVTTYTYSPTMLRLTNIKTINALGTVLQNFSYTYDGVGNITAITDSVNTATQSFKYDALNRLIQATGVSYGTKNYTFDEIGNIISKDGLTYTYSKVNAGPHAVTSLSDGTTITYDLNGNMSTKSKAGEVTQYFYDKENRLNQVKKNTTLIAEYVYDGDGGRVQKTSYVATTNSVSGGAFGTLTGTQYITTTPVISKYVGEMYEQTDNVGTAFIFLGSQRVAAIDTTSGTPMYYHGDHLGSTNVMTDNLGNQAELLEYDPYGKIQRHDAVSGNTRLAQQQFTGKKLDDETGLIYFGARYYDPSLGRFITPDTVVQAPSNPQTLNRYTYCNNNPVNLTDPSGHSWSWGKIFASFFKAVIQAVAFTVLSPFITPIGAGALIGFLSGGFSGGGFSLKGALFGAVLGGLGGGAFGSTGSNGWLGALGPKVGTALLVGGLGYSAITGGWDGVGNFAAGVGGALVGAGIGNSINGALKGNPGASTSGNKPSGQNKPIGSEKNTNEKSLDVNQGKAASNQQGLANRKISVTINGDPDPAPVSSTTLYHGGNLEGGEVQPGAFSTTSDLEHAQFYADQSGGKVYEFKVPDLKILRDRFSQDMIEKIDSYKDYNGSVGREYKFLGKAAQDLNQYRVK